MARRRCDEQLLIPPLLRGGIEPVVENKAEKIREENRAEAKKQYTWADKVALRLMKAD